MSKDITCTNFSSSGSLRNSLVLVESSFRSTRKSFCDSMISTPCLSSWVCSVDRSMSRHFESAFWNAFSGASTRSSSSIGSIAARRRRGGRLARLVIVASWMHVVHAKTGRYGDRRGFGTINYFNPRRFIYILATQQTTVSTMDHSTFLRNDSSSASGLSS